MKKGIIGALIFTILFVTNLYPQSTLLGVTSGGGNDFGVIFNLPIGGTTITSQYNFQNYSGAYPYHTKLCQASNGKLYGLTTGGGGTAIVTGGGILFEYDPVTDIYTKKIDFDNVAKGNTPYGSLIEASNGKLTEWLLEEALMQKEQFSNTILLLPSLLKRLILLEQLTEPIHMDHSSKQQMGDFME